LQDDLINKEFTAEITDITNRDLLVVALHTDSEQYQFGKKSTSNSETSLTDSQTQFLPCTNFRHLGTKQELHHQQDRIVWVHLLWPIVKLVLITPQQYLHRIIAHSQCSTLSQIPRGRQNTRWIL
jgi:hypothetical protein